MKLWKVFALALALMLALTATAFAYDGEILTITADSDDEPFSWNPETDAMAAYIRDKYAVDLPVSCIEFPSV